MQTQNTYILLAVQAVLEPEPRFGVLITSKKTTPSEVLCNISDQPYYLPSYGGTVGHRPTPGIVSFAPNEIPDNPRLDFQEQACLNMVKSFFAPDANASFLRQGITTRSTTRQDCQLFVPILASVEPSDVELRMTSGDCRWHSAQELLVAIRQHNPIDGPYSHYIVAVARTLDIFLTRKDVLNNLARKMELSQR